VALSLKYPPFDVRVRSQAGQMQIFDFIRKKWLVLTPEEWVRQHVVNYLVAEKKYPASRIAIEKELQLNDLRRRYDIVVFDQNKLPFLIVECKAPYINLDAPVLEQALRYNLVIKAGLLMVTNGLMDFIFNNSREQVDLPAYVETTSSTE
jgi:hypothetical protein